MAIELIHPMLVHFPIVLFILALGLYGYLLVTRQDLAGRATWSYAAAAVLVAGVVSAIVAAGFGDVALDIAVDKGFDEDELEEHEELAGMTIAIFGVLAAAIAFSIWKKFQVTGIKAVVFFLAACGGTAVLLSTAGHGGELVYEQGVNVETTVLTGKSHEHGMQESEEHEHAPHEHEQSETPAVKEGNS